MFKRLGILAGNLFLGGCAVTHSDRPDSSVPIVKPVWHTSDIRVADTPQVHDNVVYAPARPWSEDKKHLYAFDLQTGKPLWRTEFALAHIDFFAGPVLLLTDADGAGHTLDHADGQGSSDNGAGSAALVTN
jgi:outer membrane protein assembly factor BamB